MGSGDAEVHRARRRAITEEFPEVKKLVGHDNRTQYFAYSIVLFQIIMGYCVKDSWIGSIVMGSTVSPYACFAVLTFIHEASHSLIFSNLVLNRLIGILCNIVFLAPVSEVFRQHHNMHHIHLGSTTKDVDVPSDRETIVVGNSPVRKALWLILSFLILPARSMTKLPVRWSWLMVLNWVSCLSFAVFTGWYSLPMFTYLLLGMILSQSMHPANARQVQRHIEVYNTEQRKVEDANTPVHLCKLNTFSYYGVQNLYTLNVGYHVEHHDFGNIPWMKLPELHAIAGEKWYPKEKAYKTRGTFEIIAFITNPFITLADYAGMK